MQPLKLASKSSAQPACATAVAGRGSARSRRIRVGTTGAFRIDRNLKASAAKGGAKAISFVGVEEAKDNESKRLKKYNRIGVDECASINGKYKIGKKNSIEKK